MSPRTVLLRLLVALLALGLVGTACTGNGLEDLRDQAGDGNGEGNGEVDASVADDVEPPQAADPTLTARVGLIIATNSRTWGELLGSPNTEGVTVLFVQPEGPSADSGIEVGDVITAIDGEDATNAERGVVQLRAGPDETKTLSVVGTDGEETEIEVTAEVPGDVNLLDYYNPRIEENPDDPVARYLRAQASVPFEQAIEDTNRAIEIQPNFVEAISLRAETRWNKAQQDESLDAETVDEYRDDAMSDWNLALRLDPNNTRVLVSRAQALAQVRQAASAKSDAEKARELDPDFPGAHYAYGLAEFVLGREPYSAEPARRAIELNPYDVRYYQLLAETFMRVNRRQDARETVNAIIELVDHGPTRELLLRIPEQQ